MPEATKNYVPRSTGFFVMRETVNDMSLESAVRTTIESDRDFADFDDLRLNLIPDLIDGSFGTKGQYPTSTDQCRGYPRPTINMNFNVETFGSVPSPTFDALMCTPTMNNKVGFDVTVTISTEQAYYEMGNQTIRDLGDTVFQTITFTFAQGSTTVTSSNLDATDQDEGAGKYRVNQIEPNETSPGVYEGVNITTAYSGADVIIDYADTFQFTTFLEYSPAIPLKNFTIEHYNGSGCSNPQGTGSFETVYSLKSASSLSNGDSVWLNAGLSTPPPNGWYILWQVGSTKVLPMVM
jgi:hypothetical protein